MTVPVTVTVTVQVTVTVPGSVPGDGYGYGLGSVTVQVTVQVTEFCNEKRYIAYRDGLDAFTCGEVIETEKAIVEILYKDKTTDKKLYFAEIKAQPSALMVTL